MKRTRLFCVLLAAAMLLSLAAGGKDDPKESNSLQIGDYALLYKGPASWRTQMETTRWS